MLEKFEADPRANTAENKQTHQCYVSTTNCIYNWMLNSKSNTWLVRVQVFFQPEPDSIKCDLESTLARMVAANTMGIQTKELNTSKARSW